MYSPCFECLNRYGKQYTKECDSTCEYAVAVKFIGELQAEIKTLQDKVDDLEMEIEYHNDY